MGEWPWLLTVVPSLVAASRSPDLSIRPCHLYILVCRVGEANGSAEYLYVHMCAPSMDQAGARAARNKASHP